MHKYKAIVSDFDGTLVSGSLSLSSPVKDAIKNYISRGGIFSLATGRDYYGAIKDICIDLGVESFHIVRGGSEIVSSKTHDVVWGKYINENTLEQLLDFLHTKSNIYFAAERGTKIYTKNGEPNEMFGAKAEFESLDSIPFDNIPKVFLPAGNNEPQIVLNLLQELIDKFPQLHMIKTTHGKKIGIDINDGGVSKHVALLELSKLLHLEPKDIIGVGDSYNDYPLLSACGYKVAMGNAPTELIEIADLVVGTQAEDGILEVFKMKRDN